jgi:co-chaperonin GroES (HSP10)
MTYQASSTLSKNEWISDPKIEDPENLPEPLGWLILVRPYPLEPATQSGVVIADESINYMNYVTNIGRVVAMGPCAYNRHQHLDKEGNQFDWVKVGDFITYPRNVGSRRKFKGVSFALLNDDEVSERLPDPLVFDKETFKLNIPQEHLEKYNTIYNKGN